MKLWQRTVNNFGNKTLRYIGSAALGKASIFVVIFRNIHVLFTVFVHLWHFPSGCCHTFIHTIFPFTILTGTAQLRKGTRSDAGIVLQVNQFSVQKKTWKTPKQKKKAVVRKGIYSILVNKFLHIRAVKKKNRFETDMPAGTVPSLALALFLSPCVDSRPSHSSACGVFRVQPSAVLYSGWSSWWTGPPPTWCLGHQCQLCATARRRKRKLSNMVQKLAVKLGAKSLLLLNDCEIKKNNQMLSSVSVQIYSGRSR